MAKEGKGWFENLFKGAVGAAVVAGAPMEAGAQTVPLHPPQAEAPQSQAEAASPDSVTLEYLRDNPFAASQAEAIAHRDDALNLFKGKDPRFTDAVMTRAHDALGANPSTLEDFTALRLTGIDLDHIAPNEHFDLMVQGPLHGSSAPALVRNGAHVDLDLRAGVVRHPQAGDTRLHALEGAKRWIVTTDSSNEVALFTLLEACNNIAVRFIHVETLPPAPPELPPEQCATVHFEGMGDRDLVVAGVTAQGDASAGATKASECWPDVPPETVVCVGDECNFRAVVDELVTRNRHQLGLDNAPGIHTELYGAHISGVEGTVQVPLADADKRGWVIVCPQPTAEERAQGIQFVPRMIKWEVFRDQHQNPRLSVRDWPRLRHGRPVR